MASLYCSIGAHNLKQQSNSNPTIPNNVESSRLTKFRPQFATMPKTPGTGRKQNLKYEFKSNRSHDIKWRVWCSNEGLVGPEMETVQDSVRDFFHAINLKDTGKLDRHLSPDCMFQDPIFYIPFGGKQSVLNFLCDVMDALGASAHLVVDNASVEDDYLSTTVTWYLEWKGKKIPLTDGCSFFEFEHLHGQGHLFIRKIIGMEELPVQPGELVLKVLKTVRMAFDSFPVAAERLLEKSQGQSSPEGLFKLLDMLRAYIKKSTS